MGMYNGYIGIWLVGGKERCKCIATPFHNVSNVPLYRDTAAFKHSLGT